MFCALHARCEREAHATLQRVLTAGVTKKKNEADDASKRFSSASPRANKRSGNKIELYKCLQIIFERLTDGSMEIKEAPDNP